MRLEINEEKTRLINVYNDAARFLGMKIYCVKTKHLSISKPKAIEKRLRILNRIKIRKSIINNRILKDTADFM